MRSRSCSATRTARRWRLEATYGWEWLAELLEEAGHDVHPAHPLRTQAIAAARVRTDAVDAKTLAHLLRMLEGERVPRHTMPHDELPPEVAQQIIHDELMTAGNARLISRSRKLPWGASDIAVGSWSSSPGPLRRRGALTGPCGTSAQHFPPGSSR